VAQDLNGGDIWRGKGEFLSEATDEQEQHPIAVVESGAIGPGFRIPLLPCSYHINPERYMKMSADAYIFGRLIA
jgi:hypothetical protein